MLKYLMIVLLASASTKGCNNKAKNIEPENEVVVYEKTEEQMEHKNEEIKQIHDIYTLVGIDSLELDPTSFSMGIPNMEVNLTEKKIMGYSGCNNFFGEILNISDSTIDLGAIAATKKYCNGVDENTFLKKLNQVKKYKKNGLELFLFDNDNVLLLTFKKVD